MQIDSMIVIRGKGIIINVVLSVFRLIKRDLLFRYFNISIDLLTIVFQLCTNCTDKNVLIFLL